MKLNLPLQGNQINTVSFCYCLIELVIVGSKTKIQKYNPTTSKQKKEEKEEKDASVEPETVLEMFAADHQAAAAVHLDESKLPKWLFKYLVFRFILLDRTGETFTF